nr:hypothetical protein [Rhodoferax sp.]
MSTGDKELKLGQGYGQERQRLPIDLVTDDRQRIQNDQPLGRLVLSEPLATQMLPQRLEVGRPCSRRRDYARAY